MKFIATTGYGLEGTLNRELKALNMTVLDVSTSRVQFEGKHIDGCRASMMLRSAGRVLVEVGSFEAITFDQLFDGTYNIPWDKIVEKGSGTRVVARSVNSKLYAQRSIQSIVQKAIYKRVCDRQKIRAVYGPQKYYVDVLIHKDHVSISVDIVGDPLHKRGYRVLNPEAALRETLAASLVLLSGWRYDREFHDPFCGSGTICVEAAMAARNIGPGMKRKFAAQNFPWWPKDSWRMAKEQCRDEENRGPIPAITGGDINGDVLEMARTHARKAGVTKDIEFKKIHVSNMHLAQPQGHIITNPPYGKRLMNDDDLSVLYQKFANAYAQYPGFSCHVITSYDQIEKDFGRRADKKRKLYNGNLETVFYQFYGKKTVK